MVGIEKNGVVKSREFNETFSNIGIVGSPTIENNILSNTLKDNYVSFDINSTITDWEFKIGFTPQTVVQAYNSIISRGTPGFQLYTAKNESTVKLELNGSTTLNTMSVTMGNRYLIHCSYDGTTITTVLSNKTQGTSDTYTATTSNLSLNGTWRLGITQSGNYGYDGLIYMDDVYFRVGAEKFSPATNTTSISSYQITSNNFYEL